jgi:hypothetical protein
MEKRIVVPVTLQKDARLGDLDVDVELEVSCSLSQQSAPAQPPVEAAQPASPPAVAEPAATPPLQEREVEEQTMTLSKSMLAQARATLKEPAREALLSKPSGKAGKPAKSGKPAPRAEAAAEPRSKSSKTKIDNVLDELLKKRAPKK